MSKSPAIPLLVIAGTTASGKTAAAVELAVRHGGEIISADSMQIYRRLEVGTAKPTQEERTRAAFHLVDIVEPAASYSVADYQGAARAAISEVWGRGRLPILCGGTGLYIRAVLEGLSFPPGATPETEQIRARLLAEAEAQGAAALHARLAVLDPVTAARLPVGDTRRLIRALEVCEYTGRPFSEVARVDESREVNYNAATFVLTCPRPLLYQRVEERVDVMIAGGWVDEVAGLRAAGLTLEHQSLQAIGYRHLYHWLEQGGSLDETMALIKRDTRRYAKRQLTWFRREPGVFLEWGEGLSFAGALEVMSDHASRLTGR